MANLSLGGFFVAAEHPLPAGQVLALRLRLLGREMPLEVKVAWRNEGDRRHNPSLPTGFGVAIKRIELADKLALVDFLRGAARP